MNRNLTNVIPVLLSGGSGTRLWPISRKQYPKQFHSFTGSEHTLLQETALRIRGFGDPIVVCNEDHRFMLAEQLQRVDIKPAAIILEPEVRNSAPAVALAAMHAIKTNPDAIIAVFPADHYIVDTESFEHAVKAAIDVVKEGHYFATFGVLPTHPETGYGYIELGELLSISTIDAAEDIRKVNRFVEKPGIETAKNYVNGGDHRWNSGMFVFSADHYIRALSEFRPEIVDSCSKAYQKSRIDLDFIRIDHDEFSICPSDSIDYAVMERSNEVIAIPMDAGWSDIGSWSSVWETLSRDIDGTASFGDVVAVDVKESLIQSQSPDKLIVAIGVEDLVIVDTRDALLVACKDRVQEIKSVVETIALREKKVHLHHREVHRPWGSYDCIDRGARYQVKRITVKPGASLSLQMHHHRAEHWVVVSGTALVTIGGSEKLLEENQSVYVPLGRTHRLSNPGKVLLELIEIQSGSYLGEDDIVRFEDDFGRIELE